MKSRFRAVCLLLSVVGLAACGSSGGTQQPPAPPTITPPSPGGPDPLSFPDEPGLSAAQEDERASFAESLEFQNQWSLSAIGADYAYARGYTGAGVTVGIIDTGADPSHSALAGKLHASSGVVSQSCPGGNCSFSAIRDTGSHGTAVGGVIAAAKSGGRMHGVAYDADLLVLGIRLGTAPPVYRPVDLSNPASFRSLDEQGQGLYRRFGSATRIINHSFGYEGVVTAYSEAQYRAAFGRTVDSMAQADVPDAEKIILVWAAGNSRGRRDAQGNLADASSPNLSAATPHYFPDLRGHFISVVATDPSGTIASYSNRCGVAADYCIAAPGSGIFAPAAGRTQGYLSASGTSLAAPQVAGALALMEEAFRGQLGSTEMVSRLFAAADKTGIYADQDTYGQGLLDVEKATRPFGMTRASLGGSLDDDAAPIQNSAIAAGGAWGDALHEGLAGLELAVFDSLNAPFFAPMTAFHAPWPLDGGLRADRRFSRFLDRGAASSGVPAAALGSLTLSSAVGLAAALDQDQMGDEFSAATPTPGFANPWIGLGAAGLGMAHTLAGGGGRAKLHSGFFLQNSGVTRGERLMAAGRARGAFLGLNVTGGALAWAAELGMLRESERMLGAGTSGAYGELSGNTWFTRMHLVRQLGRGLQLLAAVQGGYTAGEAGRGLVRGMRRISSSAYSAALRWSNPVPERTESVWLAVMQPLRNESGHLELDYPVGRTRAGGVLREIALLGAKPSGRQKDLALGYERSLPSASGGGEVWRLRLELWRSFEPGHQRNARPESAVFVGVLRSLAAG